MSAGSHPCTLTKRSERQRDELTEIVHLLNEAAPLATQLNEKLLRIRALIEEAGTRTIGGKGAVRITLELLVVRETIGWLMRVLDDRASPWRWLGR